MSSKQYFTEIPKQISNAAELAEYLKDKAWEDLNKITEEDLTLYTYLLGVYY